MTEGEAMQKNTVEPTEAEPTYSYGCVFCTTGKEKFVAEQIQTACPQIRATPMRQEKYRTHQGKKSRIEAVVLPGYVFLESPVESDLFQCLPKDYVIRLLTTDSGVWQLHGEDERFARWVLKYDGLLQFSKACKVGDRIRIISGPLKDMEGRIARIDKRGRSGQVVLTFNGRNIPVWLGFELIDLV